VLKNSRTVVPLHLRLITGRTAASYKEIGTIAEFGGSVVREVRAAGKYADGYLLAAGMGNPGTDFAACNRYRIDCGAFSPFGMRVVYLRSCIRS